MQDSTERIKKSPQPWTSSPNGGPDTAARESSHIPASLEAPPLGSPSPLNWNMHRRTSEASVLENGEVSEP
ncbi:hypothetical protein OH76DRAFT_1400465 [Lentinus brumalis]|uniref:Uncharacterized protein n=1 Tax=Lentinus brumalis TaxID=2498619 RepID=A0A371DHY1_9APHY|nr:hypothetical protein OH76DRAFT_1400465 [Polyporus brumalis]